MRTNVTLPNKPSELIELALSDLVKCEQSPGYEVNLDIWHQPRGNVCVVCLAGGVMAQSLGADKTMYLEPEDFTETSRHNGNCLTALDMFRSGLIDLGWFWMFGDVTDFPEVIPTELDVAEYADDPEGFKNAMAEIASIFKKAGH
jgi:hypothetical protein